jgi:hypothetical protein
MIMGCIGGRCRWVSWRRLMDLGLFIRRGRFFCIGIIYWVMVRLEGCSLGWIVLGLRGWLVWTCSLRSEPWGHLVMILEIETVLYQGFMTKFFCYYYYWSIFILIFYYQNRHYHSMENMMSIAECLMNFVNPCINKAYMNLFVP